MKDKEEKRPWSEGELTRLDQYVREGVSYAEIARRFDRTKSSCIGMVARRGLPRRMFIKTIQNAEATSRAKRVAMMLPTEVDLQKAATLDWPFERLKELLDKFVAGKSHATIAYEMALPPSAVTRQLMLMRLATGSSVRRLPVAPKPVIAVPVLARLPPVVFEDAPRVVPELPDYAKGCCQWPLNDRKPWQFCGDRRLFGKPYCAAHQARSFGKSGVNKQDGRRTNE